MNEVNAFPKPIAGGQYLVMLRLAHDGEATPVLQKGGDPLICKTEVEAYQVITEHLLRYLRGHLVRDGEIAGRTAAEVEAHFKPVVRQKGKTRVIAVSYKKGTFGCRAGGRSAKAEEESSDTMTKPSTSRGFSG